MREKQIGIVAFLLLLFSVCWIANPVKAPPSDNFIVDFFVSHESPWKVCIDDYITNLQDANDNFPYKAVVNNTSVDLSKVTVELYEWKPTDIEVTDYTEECNPYIIEDNDTTYDIENCTMVESGSHIEQRWDWLERNLVDSTEDGSTLRNQWEEVQIKKSETKRFRRCYNFNERTRGSRGYTYLEVKGEEFYDFSDSSWWDTGTFPFGWEKHSVAKLAGMLILMNDSDCVGPNNVCMWTNNESTDQQWLVCTGAGATGTCAVGNTTDEANWVNESNMTGNNPTSVYDANYEFVLPSHNTSMLDYTSNGVVFTKNGDPTQATGVFGKGIDYDGTGDYYTFAPPDIFDGDFTIEFWFYPTVSERTVPLSIESRKNAYFDYNDTGGTTEDLMEFKYYQSSSGHSLTCTKTALNTWNYVVLVNNTTGTFLYQNATLCDSDTGISIDNKATTSSIGAYSSGSLELDGKMDEARLSSVWRNESYITATWNIYLNSSSMSAEASGILTVLTPENITYATTSITINASTSVSSNVSWTEDGGANQTMRNSSTTFQNVTTLVEGVHDIFVYSVNAVDDTDRDSEQIFLTVDTSPPVIIIEAPTGTYLSNASVPLNYNATDAYSAIENCWYSLNNASNVSLAGCANTTFPVTQAGVHNISVFVNDSAGWENETSIGFTYDPLMNFRANDSITGAVISDFEVSVIGTGATGTTTNGTAPILLSAIGYGALTVRIASLGYNTTDFARTFTNETLLTENFTLGAASVNITVFDEADAALGITTNITFNITISNDTRSNTWYNVSEFFKYTNDTASGAVTISINSYGYQPREYYTTITENIANNVVAYLLKTADALYVRMHILTIDGVAITDANVTAKRQINGSWTLMEERATDDSGVSGLSLAPFTTYRITASASGYVTQIRSIIPSASDYYFYMQSLSNISYHTLFENITYSLTPTNPILYPYEIYNFVFWINSSDSSLEWYSMNITYNDSTGVFFKNITASATGGNITHELNASYLSGNYTIDLRIKKTDWPMWNGSYVYRIMNVTGGSSSIWGVLTAMKGSDMSPFFLNLAAIFVAFLGAGMISKTNMGGGGFVAMGILIIFTVAGWFAWEMMLLTGLTLLATAFLQGKL